jgi:predicted Fe-S protein YdhL (DUF1289 family)
MPSTTNTIPSPCKGICNLDFATHTICQGCGRHVTDIREWRTYTDAQKSESNSRSEQRLEGILRASTE